MKVSIAGLGVMGKNHLRSCKNLKFEIISTYEPNNNDNYDEYLDTLKNCEAIIVASPTKYHTKIILDAKERNKDIKVLCEKPITFSCADPLLDKVLKYEDSVLVGQIERFNPVCSRIIELVDSKQVIQIKTKRVNNIPSREKIHCKKDIGIHDIDFVCSLFGAFPKSVQVLSNNDFSHENMFYKIGNCTVINEVSWNYPFKDRTFEILTDAGLYVGQFYNQELNFFDWRGYKNEIKIEKKEPLELELLHLKEMVEYGKNPRVKISENLKILKLMGYDE